MTREHKLSYTEHTRWAMDRIAHRSFALLGIFGTRLIDGLKDFIPDSQPSRKTKLQSESQINPSQYILKEAEWIDTVLNILWLLPDSSLRTMDIPNGEKVNEILIDQKHPNNINSNYYKENEPVKEKVEENIVDPNRANFTWIEAELRKITHINTSIIRISWDNKYYLRIARKKQSPLQK